MEKGGERNRERRRKTQRKGGKEIEKGRERNRERGRKKQRKGGKKGGGERNKESGRKEQRKGGIKIVQKKRKQKLLESEKRKYEKGDFLKNQQLFLYVSLSPSIMLTNVSTSSNCRALDLFHFSSKFQLCLILFSLNFNSKL